MNENPSRQSKKKQLGLTEFPGQKKGSSVDESMASVINQSGISDRVKESIPLPSEKPVSRMDNEAEEWKEPGSKENRPYPTENKASHTVDKTLMSQVSEHPVIIKLRQSFGIDLIKTIDVPIRNIIWTLRPLNFEMSAYAIRVADRLSDSISEHIMKLALARVSCAVAAIDGISVQEIYNIPLEGKEVITDKFNPPPRIAQICASRIYDLLVTDIQFGLSRVLSDAYDSKLDQLSDITSDLEQKATYKCSTCSSIKKYVERRTEGGELEPYFCELDGSVMEPILTTEEATNSPLA